MEQQAPKSQDHNLVNQVKANRFSSKDFFTYFFRILPILGAATFGFGFRWFLDGKTLLFPVLLMLFAYLIFTGLATLVNRDAGVRYRIMALEIIAILIPFIGWSGWVTTIGVLIVLLSLFFFWGISRARYELFSSNEINFWRIARPQFGKMLTGLTFLVILFYMPKLSSTDVILTEGVFQRFFGSASDIATSFYPELEISPTSTIGGMAESIALSKLRKEEIFKNLTDEQREMAVKAAVNDFISTLQKNFGTEVRAEDPMTRVFYDFLVDRMESWKNRFGITFSVIWGIVMFFLVRGLGTLVSLMSSFALFILYHILLSTHVIQIRTENRPFEILELV